MHKYTKSFIRLLKEEQLYSAFINGIKKYYKTSLLTPVEKINDIILANLYKIDEENYLPHLIDVCFRWDSGIIAFENFENLFCKALKINKK